MLRERRVFGERKVKSGFIDFSFISTVRLSSSASKEPKRHPRVPLTLLTVWGLNLIRIFLSPSLSPLTSAGLPSLVYLPVGWLVVQAKVGGEKIAKNAQTANSREISRHFPGAVPYTSSLLAEDLQD